MRRISSCDVSTVRRVPTTKPGDLLVQPNWTWHGTTNPGNEPVFWIDIQDRNLVNYLGAFRRDLWPDNGVEPTVHPENHYAKTTGLIRPTNASSAADVLPPIHYRWRDMANALAEITESAALSPYDGKMFEYRHPSTGGHTLPTLSAQLQLVEDKKLLVASLACTPAREILGWTWAIALRRMLGLFAFFYASLHVATYAAVDQRFDWQAIFADVTKRRFIYVGLTTFVLLVPLAVTSTNGWVRRLGFAGWKRLHRLAYLATILAVVHFIWRVKKDLHEPLTYASVLVVLLLVRAATAARRATTAE
jgi:sulfoxide reductase heme-binding subunit YedZ